MSTSSDIRVFPKQVKILDYQKNPNYNQTIIVQNVAKQAVNIAIIEPAASKSSGFTLVSSTTSIYSNEILSDPNFINSNKSNSSFSNQPNVIPGKKVAAGLETSFKIRFTPQPHHNSTDIITDKIGIFVNGKKHDFILSAHPPQENISTFGDLNFGSVIADQTMRSKYVSIKNTGKADGYFSTKLVTNTDEISMEEIDNQLIRSNSETNIKVNFTPTNASHENIVAQVLVQEQGWQESFRGFNPLFF